MSLGSAPTCCTHLKCFFQCSQQLLPAIVRSLAGALPPCRRSLLHRSHALCRCFCFCHSLHVLPGAGSAAHGAITARVWHDKAHTAWPILSGGRRSHERRPAAAADGGGWNLARPRTAPLPAAVALERLISSGRRCRQVGAAGACTRVRRAGSRGQAALRRGRLGTGPGRSSQCGHERAGRGPHAGRRMGACCVLTAAGPTPQQAHEFLSMWFIHYTLLVRSSA